LRQEEKLVGLARIEPEAEVEESEGGDAEDGESL